MSATAVMPLSQMATMFSDNPKSRKIVNPLPQLPGEPPGMDCFADDRDALNDFAKYFNNAHLSDVTLLVGDEAFPAHRIILTKSSEVFERMLSQLWSGTKREIALTEEPQCNKVFAAFLRFLYCNHISLHAENTLPILMLADKYNVLSLRKVALDFAINHILPMLSLKDLFHVWFQYGTKSYHQSLIYACITVLAQHFNDIITSEEWEKDWLEMDRDQLTEFLKCNELTLPNEFKLWEAVQRWLLAPAHPERRGNTCAPLLAHILPLVRFPFMTADELAQQLERSPFAEQHAKLFQPQIAMAFKFQALPLTSRVGVKEFTGSQFLLRNYTDIRWDKQIKISDFPSIDKYTEFTFKFQTRSSTYPTQSWDWELKVHPKGFSSANEDFRVILSSNVILDQARSVEYLLSIVDDKKVLRSLAGRKGFTKTRYCVDLEMEKRVGLEEFLCENSPLLVNGQLRMQLTLRPPID